ncbi:GIY-YIG nuclease family protein [Maribellus maritimus]|uniref:GIY-YIG nuclease family protein n=1 Tax=Maribellus maritimus TaxID=2870838 RepID=UPI001EEC4C14|nr:GIY-YIG nuclease family protein [Maribellus maritimus]MCG6190026.1 GIY-YIG nuclease family protein [Maribellus maritimus]
MRTRKELKNIYKEMKFKIGVFQIRNMVNQKIFIGSSTDLNAIWNRIRTELRFGNYPNIELQRDWNNFGEDNFIFEILGEIKQEDDEKNPNYRKEVKELEKMFIEELQPFDDKGYNLVFTKRK